MLLHVRKTGNMSISDPSSGALSRRTLLLGGLAVTAAGGAGLYHLHRHRHAGHRKADGLYHQIRLACSQTGTNTVLHVAAQKDFFTRYNLDLTPTDPAPSDAEDAIAAVARGTASFAIAPAVSWLPHLYEGLPASLILGVQPGSFRLLVRRATDIKRLDQLLTRTIFVGEHNLAGKLFFATMMRRKGMNSMGAVNWKIMPDADLTNPAILAQCDAVVLSDPQAWQILTLQKDIFSELASSNTGSYANRTNLILGVSHTALQNENDAAIALVLALRDAARWAHSHLQETAILLAGKHGEMNAQDILQMLRNEPSVQAILGQTLREQVAQYCDELQLLGLLPQDTDSSALTHRFTHNVLRN